MVNILQIKKLKHKEIELLREGKTPVKINNAFSLVNSYKALSQLKKKVDLFTPELQVHSNSPAIVSKSRVSRFIALSSSTWTGLLWISYG